MRIKMEDLRITALDRPEGYMDDVLRHAKEVTSEYVEWDDAVFEALRQKYNNKESHVSLPVFTDSDLCKSRQNCQLCRDTGINGDAFRQLVRASYKMPDSKTDFTCPFNVPWDFQSPQSGQPVIDRKKIWASVRDSWNKANAFSKSVASRGLTENKVDDQTKALRVLSCHGDPANGVPACEAKTQSKKGDYSYCNFCGCGDREMARLDGEGYTKLDYPYLECPMKKPGFSNAESKSPKKD